MLITLRASGRTSCESSVVVKPERAKGTFAFHAWIRKAISNDKPYDEFVRDILGATGDEQTSPPTVWVTRS
jgi:hypothetical protein